MTFPKACGVLAGWYLAFFTVLTIAILSLPDDVPPGQCEGIGFGCTLGFQSAAILILAMYGPYALAISALASLLILAAMTALKVRSPLVIGTAAGILPAVATLLIICGFGLQLVAPEESQEPREPAPKVTRCIPISGGRQCPGG